MMAWMAAGTVRRRVILTVVEFTLLLVSVGAAVAIIYSGDVARWSARVALAGIILMLLKLAAGALTGAFSGRWRFVGLRDAVTITQ